MTAPAIGQPGIYTICCGWRDITDLVPLNGRRMVRIPRVLGEEIGRCKWHPKAATGIAAYVVRDQP